MVCPADPHASSGETSSATRSLSEGWRRGRDWLPSAGAWHSRYARPLSLLCIRFASVTGCAGVPLPEAMAEREGFEPSPPAPPSLDVTATCRSGEAQSSPIASPNLGKLSPELAEIVAVWPSLAPEIQAALLTLARAAHVPRQEGSGVEATPVRPEAVALEADQSTNAATRSDCNGLPAHRLRQRRPSKASGKNVRRKRRVRP